MGTLKIHLVSGESSTIDDITEEKHSELQIAIEDTNYNSIICGPDNIITINKANVTYTEYKKDLD